MMSANVDTSFCHDCAACFEAANYLIKGRGIRARDQHRYENISHRFRALRFEANAHYRTVIATYAQSLANYAMCLYERDVDQATRGDDYLLAQGIERGLSCRGGQIPERCIDVNFGTLWPLIDELRTHSRQQRPEQRDRQTDKRGRNTVTVSSRH